ncbi:MAG: alanine racemase [Candidatus Eremiobacteraeota bacterium]|nr:alanine racemase [Candidatus Eremiobacteraeota bacterium]
MIGQIRISSAALERNARALREIVRPAKAAFVVKSNAYGHGLAQTARAIEGVATQFCVFSLDEAAALRDGGITAPILILGPIPEARLSEALAVKAAIALWDTHAYVHHVAAAARKRNVAFPVHVKVNTGTSRFGLDLRDAHDAIEDYLRRPELEIAGMFSHLAAAEELDSPYTDLQLDRFNALSARVGPLFATRAPAPRKHIAASAAALLWPRTRLDAARFGIALYGLWPSAQTREAMNDRLTLVPALSYTSELVAVREVEPGTPVGYGGAFHAARRMRVGMVPLGYADGVPRLLSNRGAFAVDGARCPIVGRVCMNVTMLDLTAAPGARPGTRVTLLGRDGDCSIAADDWATWAETINYEIVARLPAEIPRVFEETPDAAGTLV